MHQCGLCKSELLNTVIDLGDTPIAHEFSVTAKQAIHRKKYPMKLQVCQTCGMGQLASVIDPNILYSEYNFCFSSWKNQPHIDDECQKLKKHLPQGTLLEVGCNDGLFLHEVSQHGQYRCIGIEPNKVSSVLAKQKGFDIINKFFDDALSDKLLQQPIDAVFARQVLEHIPNVANFLISVNKLLNIGGFIGIEVPNTEIALKTGDVSCLWEEHVNYFTPDSLKVALHGTGFNVIEYASYPFSGEAIFMLAVKEKSVSSFTLTEQPSIDLYLDYQNKVNNYQQCLFDKIKQYKEQGYSVVLYGSGCRSSMILHGLSLNKYIDHIVDDQPEKQGLYMPNTDHPVQALTDLDQKNCYLFILSVNSENDYKVQEKITAIPFKHALVISAHSPKNIINELSLI